MVAWSVFPPGIPEGAKDYTETNTGKSLLWDADVLMNLRNDELISRIFAGRRAAVVLDETASGH